MGDDQKSFFAKVSATLSDARDKIVLTSVRQRFPEAIEKVELNQQDPLAWKTLVTRGLFFAVGSFTEVVLAPALFTLSATQNNLLDKRGGGFRPKGYISGSEVLSEQKVGPQRLAFGVASLDPEMAWDGILEMTADYLANHAVRDDAKYAVPRSLDPVVVQRGVLEAAKRSKQCGCLELVGDSQFFSINLEAAAKLNVKVLNPELQKEFRACQRAVRDAEPKRRERLVTQDVSVGHSR